jgi:5-(carboxyamino)imidazole ribonucleotide synthase
MRQTHIGIIGGGQLGMLLIQASIPFPCRTSVYDPNPNCSSAHFTDSFTQGNFEDEEALINFAKDCDVILFETESVNVQALLKIKAQGKRVLSSPESLAWIQSKGKQREVLKEAGIPQPSFKIFKANELQSYEGPFPIVQKWLSGGYDGQGVFIHKDKTSLNKAEAKDSVLEEKIRIKKELSLLFARNESGQMEIYPAIEMVFDPKLNLIDHLIAPARITEETTQKMIEIAKKLSEKLTLVGVYAIEFFLTEKNELLINEISPRTHNSGHHTVSANVCSQYEQQIRIALGLPLGSSHQTQNCIMANLLADDSRGKTQYIGLEEAFALDKVQFFFYGKESTRPGRKMGHALIFYSDLEEGLATLKKLRSTLTITSHEQ